MRNPWRIFSLLALSLACAPVTLQAAPCTRTARLVCAPGCWANMQGIQFTHHNNVVGSLPSISCDATVEGGAVATAEVQLDECDVTDIHLEGMNVTCTDQPFTPFRPFDGDIPANQVPWGVELVIENGIGRVRVIGQPSPGSAPADGDVVPAREGVVATLRLDPVSPDGIDDPSQGGGLIPLLQNMPNPFGRSTSIHYVLPRAAGVRLAVFSAGGSLVRQLVNGVQAAGPHDVPWDGTDGNGRRVPTGKYVYRLVVDGDQRSESMTVLR